MNASISGDNVAEVPGPPGIGVEERMGMSVEVAGVMTTNGNCVDVDDDEEESVVSETSTIGSVTGITEIKNHVEID